MAAPNYRLSRGAASDLEEISDYLGKRSPSAADRVIDELYDTFGALARNPQSGTDLSTLRDGPRVIVPSRPANNDLVFFYQSPEGVKVSRLLHGARDWTSMLATGEMDSP